MLYRSSVRMTNVVADEPAQQSGTAPGTPSTRIDIFAYFSPASEIDELDRFIGRAPELERGLGALRSHGASVAIFGEAGVGKTSLAMQLARIAVGDHTDLIRRANLERLCPPEGFRHPVVYYACQHSDRDIAQVLLSLLNDHRPPFSLGALLEDPMPSRQTSRPRQYCSCSPTWPTSSPMPTTARSWWFWTNSM
jgi:hypothetical protein